MSGISTRIESAGSAVKHKTAEVLHGTKGEAAQQTAKSSSVPMGDRVSAAGTAVTESNAKKHPTSKLGKIVGAAVGGAILLILIVFAVWYDRRKKRKARQGTQLRETGVDGDEEARPMVQSGEGMGMSGGERVGMPRPLMLQAGATYIPPQGEGMYAGSGYGGEKDLLYEHPTDAGHRGTDFYRNQ